ncbi:MAG TPA: DUF4878 domain-containing protein [Pyrinomonadaceae bacterium]|jgi:hypothetical protein|nr:DUF4878 domain-containing protein [Pyrinomonadaceae bacterium]
MRILFTFLAISLCILGFAACGAKKELTPVDTFKEYVKAIKKKDVTSMKLLLSNATMKMHEQEAKAQNTTVDDIVKRETLFTENQTTVEYRNEKVEGDKATLQVKNAYGSWETVPFVREDDQWKIDKVGYADQMLKDMDESNRKLDELINGGGNPTPNP